MTVSFRLHANPNIGEGVSMNHHIRNSSAVRRLVALAILVLAVMGASNQANAAQDTSGLPDPAVDSPLAAKKGKETTVVAGGCFWGVQAIYQHVKGVKDAVSGYAGGSVKSPSYEQVGTGETGHAESVQITFDPSKISYGQLLKIFFSVVHDPTQLNRQGPDTGTQYRSVIFYANDEQKHIAEAYIAQLEQARLFPRPIVTQVVPLKAFYTAELYHQGYASLHPDNPYIARNDAPKVERLGAQFPELYKK
jgi:peptide-methionine (S)-S-oxide reductase